MHLRDIVNGLITLPGRHIRILPGVEVDRTGGIERFLLESGEAAEEIAVSYDREDFEAFREGILTGADHGGFNGIIMPRHADRTPIKDISCLGRLFIDEFRHDIAGWVARSFTPNLKWAEPVAAYAGAVFFPRDGGYYEKLQTFHEIASHHPYMVVFGNGNTIQKKMRVNTGAVEIAALYNVPIIPVGIHYDYLINNSHSRHLATDVRIVFGRPVDPLEISGCQKWGALLSCGETPLIKVRGNLQLMLAQSAYLLGKTHAFFGEPIPEYISKKLNPALYFGKS